MGRRKAGQGSKWIRASTRARIYTRDRHTCVYCGRGSREGVALSLDHVRACELGGDNAPSNLVTACISCNSAKRALPLAEFIAHLGDLGHDPEAIRRAIRNATRRALPRLAS